MMLNRLHPGNRSLLIVQGLCLSAGLSLLTIMPYSLIIIGYERTLLWGIGAAAMLILTVPFLLYCEFDMFEPLSFVMLIVLFGITLRAIYIAAYDNDTINNELLLGRDRDFLLAGGIIILLSLASLVSGYMVRVPALNILRFRLIRKEHWNTLRLFFTVILFSVVGAIAMILFIRKVGIVSITLSTLSSHHSFVVEGATYKLSALGYYRWAASFTVPAFYLYFSWFAGSGKKWFSLLGAGAMLLGLLAAIFPIFDNIRSDVISIIIFALVLWHFLRRKIRIHTVIWTFIFILAIFIAMIMLRVGKYTNVGALASGITGEVILDKLVGNRNLFGIDKTGHIIEAVPRKMPYLLGRSFVSIVFAPIPRTTWIDKPPIHLGPIVGQDIYGTKDESGRGAGIPPGFVPELYMNFGLPGVMIGMFLLGMWLRFIYISFKPHILHNKNAALVYVTITYGFSFCLLGMEFAGAVIFIMKLLIPIFAALWFIGRGKNYATKFFFQKA